MKILEADKIGSAISPLSLTKTVTVIDACAAPKVGDVVVVRALSESVTYGNLELPSGRLAKINSGDVLLGVLGKRRALKGFVGDVPKSIKKGDRLHLLNMGGLIGVCLGHHSALSDAIQVEVLGVACDADENVLNIADRALKADEFSETGRADCRCRGNLYEQRKNRRRRRNYQAGASRRIKGCGRKAFGRRLPARHFEYGRPRRGRDGELSRLRNAFDGRCRKSRADGESRF